MSTLRKNYSVKRLRQENLLHEAIIDAFSNNSGNVQKVKTALTGAKNVAQTYGMKSILTAIATAEQKFMAGIANPKAAGDSISYILTFSDIMAEFFQQMDQWVMQLPAVSQAMDASDDPVNAQKTLKELLGDQAPTLTNIVQKQFDKSAGGFMKSLGRLFKSGRMTSAKDALTFVGLNAQAAAEDILNIQVSKYKQLLQAGKQVQAPQITPPNPNQNPQSGSTQSTPSTHAQAAQTSQPTQAPVPAQGTTTSTGNAQLAQKPSPEDAQKRDTTLQGVVKNRNAFNTQLMSQLSNDEIKSDLLQIAQSLGIKLV